MECIAPKPDGVHGPWAAVWDGILLLLVPGRRPPRVTVRYQPNTTPDSQSTINCGWDSWIVIGQFHPVVKVAQQLRSAGHGTMVSVGSDRRELVLGAMYVIPVGVVATGQEIVARSPLIHDSGGPEVATPSSTSAH